jgi:UDP-N-acetylmuramate--alanine ligase
VAEADESDASFLHLQPMMAVVTNIDNDHLITHGGDFSKLKQSFLDFLHNLPFYGLAVLCRDDREVAEILPNVARPIVTYGVSDGCDFRGTNIRRNGSTTAFTVKRPEGWSDLEVELSMPGHHNVLNALAAIAIATEVGIDDAAIQAALKCFQGIDRRLQVIGDLPIRGGRATVIDDYGHHPTEIAATMDAVRQGWPNRRIVVAFQPHRYTRTRDLLDDFADVLSRTDVLLVTEVYAAGEEPIHEADGRAICRALRTRGLVEPIFVPKVERLDEALASVIRPDDVIVTMGAGNIGAISHELPARLRARSAS